MHFCHLFLDFDMKYAPLRCGALYPSRVAEVWCFQGALNADGSFGPCHLVLLIA